MSGVSRVLAAVLATAVHALVFLWPVPVPTPVPSPVAVRLAPAPPDRDEPSAVPGPPPKTGVRTPAPATQAAPAPPTETAPQEVPGSPESHPPASTESGPPETSPSPEPAGRPGLSNAEYQTLIRDAVRARRTYPPASRSRGEQGTVLLVFAVGADGALVGTPAVERSSLVSRLDAAGLDAVRAAAPFPVPPDGTTWTFRLPLEFVLN